MIILYSIHTNNHVRQQPTTNMTSYSLLHQSSWFEETNDIEATFQYPQNTWGYNKFDVPPDASLKQKKHHGGCISKQPTELYALPSRTRTHAFWTYPGWRQRCPLSSPSCQHSRRRRFLVRLLLLGPGPITSAASVSVAGGGQRSQCFHVCRRKRCKCHRTEPSSDYSRILGGLKSDSFMATLAMKNTLRCVMEQGTPVASTRTSAPRPRFSPSRVCPSRGCSHPNTWAQIWPPAAFALDLPVASSPWPLQALSGFAKLQAAGHRPLSRLFCSTGNISGRFSVRLIRGYCCWGFFFYNHMRNIYNELAK